MSRTFGRCNIITESKSEMNAKPPAKKEVRLPKPELMLTRHKSSLLKRQLRNKDDSIKKISEMTSMLYKERGTKQQILKSPNKEQSTKQQVKSPKKKSMSPKDKKESNEYYPEKKARTKPKSLLLKPPHQMKQVGSKRKKAVPIKGAPPPASMQQLVAAAELVLDDEDLMEILTCASPVWWEDHQGYDEDPIYILSPSDKEYLEIKGLHANTDSESRQTEPPDMSDIIIPETKQTDDRFMKKRSKLENLLGNIKNKINNNDVIGKNETETKNKEDSNIVSDVKSCPISKDKEDSNIQSDKVDKTDDTASEFNDTCKITEQSDIKIEKQDETTDCTTAVHNDDAKEGINECLSEENVSEKEIIKEECIENTNSGTNTGEEIDTTDVIKEEVKTEGEKRKVTTSESTEEDVFSNLQNEELLRDLENMDIPIKIEDTATDVVGHGPVDIHSGLVTNDADPLQTDKNKDTLPCEQNTDSTKVENAEENVRKIGRKRPLSDADELAVAESKIPKILSTFSLASSEVNLSSIKNEDTITTTAVSGQEVDIKKEDDDLSIHPEEIHATESKKDKIEDINESLAEDRKIDVDTKTTTNIAENNQSIEAIDAKETTKDDSNNKQNETQNTKKVNKEQLLAVYKTITALKDGNENEENKTIVNDDVLNKDTLDFYYKKNKKRDRQSQEVNIKNDDDDKNVHTEENKNELCQNCNCIETTKSIVSDVKNIKYCLKCSSIFETDSCDYCKNNATQPSDDTVDVKSCKCNVDENNSTQNCETRGTNSSTS